MSSRAEVPRLLECKSCKHEWRARETTACPKCTSVDVLSRCGVKRPNGPCRNYSMFGQSRCRLHGAKRQAEAAAARIGRSALWGNRTYADAVLRAASDPTLRDLTWDIAAIQELLDEALSKATAGEGGASAWKRLERILSGLAKAFDGGNIEALGAGIAQLAELVQQERIRSSALLDVDMLAHRRTEMLKAEASIAQAARATMSILDVEIFVRCVVGLVRELAPRDLADQIGRRMALMAPGTNTVAGVEVAGGSLGPMAREMVG